MEEFVTDAFSVSHFQLWVCSRPYQPKKLPCPWQPAAAQILNFYVFSSCRMDHRSLLKSLNLDKKLFFISDILCQSQGDYKAGQWIRRAESMCIPGFCAPPCQLNYATCSFVCTLTPIPTTRSSSSSLHHSAIFNKKLFKKHLPIRPAIF